MKETRDFGTLDITDFTVGGMLRSGIAIRRAVRGAGTLEAASQIIVRYLYDQCTNPATGTRSCALVRFYQTLRYGQLPPDLQRFADRQLGTDDPHDDLRCLTLMATAGDETAWNDRRSSRGHQTIPLTSAESIRAAPMILRLIEDIGIDIETLIRGAEPPRENATLRNYDVFHVPDAVGSPYIPAQKEFVEPYGISSVVGFGGLLRSSELFGVVMFSRDRIPPHSAGRFKAIALDVRSVLFNFDGGTLWAQ